MKQANEMMQMMQMKPANEMMQMKQANEMKQMKQASEMKLMRDFFNKKKVLNKKKVCKPPGHRPVGQPPPTRRRRHNGKFTRKLNLKSKKIPKLAKLVKHNQ
mmetsp:Transcript_6311/g.7947  ORF Transcript_6311/g.7947 Transcript_6311/m.7947 type:complete len:102 (-) Transcript_6311:93-398(-)